MPWEVKKLGEVCEISAGNSAPQDEKMFTNGIFKFFRTSDVGQIHIGIIENSADKLNNLGIKKLTFYKKGTLLFPKSGASTFLNHRVIMGVDGYVSSHLATLKANPQNLNDKFLFYFSLSIDSRDLMQDQNYPSLRLSDIQEITILVPPISEQKRIVEILNNSFEKIERAKRNAERNLTNSKEIFESYLESVFENKGTNWEEKELGELGKTQTGTTPKTADKENYGDYIPFVTPADIDFFGDGGIQYKLNGLSEKGLKNGRKIEKDSILMVCIGATIGKVGFSNRAVSCNQQINSLTVNNKLYPKFFYYALSTKGFFDKVIKSSAQATLPIINKSKWEKLCVSYPKSITEQQAIVKKLDKLSAETKKLEAIYIKKLTDLEELKKSILQKAFKGELTSE